LSQIGLFGHERHFQLPFTVCFQTLFVLNNVKKKKTLFFVDSTYLSRRSLQYTQDLPIYLPPSSIHTSQFVIFMKNLQKAKNTITKEKAIKGAKMLGYPMIGASGVGGVLLVSGVVVYDALNFQTD
jgi:hypothetical protein